jgi:predicted tellurium resistance membrane protein TerC
MESIFEPQNLASLFTLLIMEIVLGIDNIVFITLLSGQLPKTQQTKGRILGLSLALLFRILMLISISWVMTLTHTLFNPADWFGIKDPWHERLAISGRDLILLAGGLFLIYKSNKEIHDSLEGIGKIKKHQPSTLWPTVLQIGLLDIIFGLDSVITAVGMSNHLGVMITAVVIAMFLMMLASRSLSDFVNKHPSVKLLALAFLLLIGVSLIAESIDQPISKGYIYFAMSFSIFVEFLILRLVKKKSEAVQLKEKINE